MSEIYSPRTLAQRWECRESYVRRLIAHRKLPYFRAGKKLLRIRRVDIEDFESTGGPTKPELVTSVTENVVGGNTALLDSSEPVVYFVGFGKYVKIGFTTNLATRIAALSTGCPEPLNLLGVIKGASRSTEKALHYQFMHLRTNGEWFRLTSELRDFIKARCDDAVHG